MPRGQRRTPAAKASDNTPAESPATVVATAANNDSAVAASTPMPPGETVRVEAKYIAKPKAVEVEEVIHGPKIAIPNELHDSNGRPPIFQVRTDNQLRELAESSQAKLNHNIASLVHAVTISLVAGNLPLNVWKLHDAFVKDPNKTSCTGEDLDALVTEFRRVCGVEDDYQHQGNVVLDENPNTAPRCGSNDGPDGGCN